MVSSRTQTGVKVESILALPNAGNETRTDEAAPSGFVYYVRVGELIKIGYSANPRDRLRQYPPGSVLLAIEPGDLALEQARLATFADALAWGNEWFSETPQVLAHIVKLVKKHGNGQIYAPRYRERNLDRVKPASPKMTIAEAAEYMQVSTKTIRRWVTAGLVKAERIGPRLIRVDRESLATAGKQLQYTE